MSTLLGVDLYRRTLCIAEVSANHCQSLDLARELVRAAAAAGADAVKIQTYTADDMVANDPRILCPAGPWKGRPLYDLYRECSTPREWFPILRDEAAKAGIPLFTSVFNPADIPYLEAEGCPAYKVAASEANWQELLEALETTSKPVIVSGRGFCGWDDRDGAGWYGLQVVPEYPAPANAYQIRALGAGGAWAGISDHTAGIELAPIAVAAGARIVEKHLCLSVDDYIRHGIVPARVPDYAFSLPPTTYKEYPDDPDLGFAGMVQAIRRVESILHGTGKPRPSMPYARSLWVTKPVCAGDRFTRDNVRALRPAGGLEPGRLADVLKRCSAVDLAGNEPLKEEHLQ